MKFKGLDETEVSGKMLYNMQKSTLTVKDACLYLGISTSFMYKLTSARFISQAAPNGKIIFFDRLELDKWALKNKRKCVEEIEAELQKLLLKSRKPNT